MNKTLTILLMFLLLMISCNEKEKKAAQATPATAINETPFFKLSLAQWSLHKAIRDDKTLDPIDFAEKASELGFEGIEYVSQLYNDEIKNLGMSVLLDSLKSKSELFEVENVLIMIDGEGDLASTDVAKRNEAVENHKKWVDAAQFLGCHSIRVNLFGTNDPVIWKKTAVDGLSKLSEYASGKNINVIVENHGSLSSNAALLVAVINEVNKPNCGVLPDFGNFCLKREGGAVWDAKCIEEYDKYQGVEEMMPLAKAVSAKSYDFDENGNETTIDYVRMLKIVKDAGYTGFIGVEYEGENFTEEEGILATKNLLLKSTI